MSEENITITLKPERGNGHWVVLRHASVDGMAKLIEDYFDIKQGDLTLNEFVAEAERIFQGHGNVVREFGATPTSVEKTSPSGNAETETSVEAEGASDSEALGPVESLVKKMKEAGSVDDLRTLWLENKALYEANKSVQEAYSTRGRELTA